MNKLLFPPLLAFLMLMSAAAQADIGKQQAVSIAQSIYPGRVLAVKQVQASNGAVYRVKTLSTAGNVYIIVIDANSGKVISKQ
jgi:uncharacterized membrane protein YkoI